MHELEPHGPKEVAELAVVGFERAVRRGWFGSMSHRVSTLPRAPDPTSILARPETMHELKPHGPKEVAELAVVGFERAVRRGWFGSMSHRVSTLPRAPDPTSILARQETMHKLEPHGLKEVAELAVVG